MNRMLQNLRTDTKGNALAIFAAALVPLVAMVGSGLDVSLAYMAKAKMQNACDAAVLAGRQSMDGNRWTDANKAEAEKFFDFNFPEGTLGTQELEFTVEPDEDDSATLVGSASGVLPTSLMHIFGFDTLPVQADCDAKRDLGHNDVMLVLDVTGSMNRSPSTVGGKSKIGRLRDGASGLYRALDDTENGSVTRFGMVSYSQTVNVARSLRNSDLLVEQLFLRQVWEQEVCSYRRSGGNWSFTGCTTNTYTDRDDTRSSGWRQNGNDATYTYDERSAYRDTSVHIKNTQWGRTWKSDDVNLTAFRESGDGCIEERSSVGRAGSPVSLAQTVSQSDIDAVASNRADVALQWGRYDPRSGDGYHSIACPAESKKLQTYTSERAFNDAIDDVTATVEGNTYHDIGMLWGARFLSPTGMFSSDNPTTRGSVRVNRHIVFMTDGEMVTNGSIYSAYGVDNRHDRIEGAGSLNAKHIERFHATCSRVKESGTTVWVIALDVTAIGDIEDCATSRMHFYTSDGSDLEEVFEMIGRGIGNLRLTR